MDYKRKLQNLNFKNANNFFSEQTIDFGNKTVITSAILFLISFNFFTLNSFEIGGVNVSMKTGLFTFVLACVNIYFYRQFVVTKNVDEASFTLSDDIKEFMDQVQENDTAEIDELNALNDIIEGNIELLKSDIDANTKAYIEQDQYLKLTRAKVISEKLSASRDELTHDTARIKFFTDTVETYHRLNVQFPTYAYYVSAGAVIFRFIITTISFIQGDKPFIEFFDKDLEIIKSIFKVQE